MKALLKNQRNKRLKFSMPIMMPKKFTIY